MTERISTLVLASAALLLLVSVCGMADEYTHVWIDQESGVNTSDTSGTEEQPFKSITYAFERAEYLGRPDPWYVHIGPGVYDSNSVRPQNEQEAFPIQLRHGMIFEGTDPCTCVLDGKYNAASHDPLLYGETATLEISSLTLRNMIHYGTGGAVELINCAGRIEDCLFHHNEAGDGGGLWISAPVGPPRSFDIISCEFRDNESGGAWGGGFYVEGSLTGNIINCTFTGNRASGVGRGGGFLVESSLNGNVSDCRFITNTAGMGAGFHAGTLSGNITRCTFERNSIGGGFQVDVLNGDVTDCVFSDNSGEYINPSGGFFAWSLRGDVTDCTFVRNSVTVSGVGASAFFVEEAPNIKVTRCNFIENTNDLQGAVAIGEFTGGSIENCRFVGNTGPSVWLGGGTLGVEAAAIRNCLFVAPDSLGNVNGWAVQTGHNTLIAGNTMVGRGLATQAWGTAICLQLGPFFRRGVLESRICNNVIAETQEGIHLPEGTDIPITYNCFHDVNQVVVQGETYLGNDLWWIESNLSGFRNSVYRDPGFIAGDPTYHIGAASPCIDSGDPNYVPDANETDLDGKPRLVGLTVDKGAYEYAPSCLPESHEDYLEWMSLGRPDCWCYPRQCHGDADGLKEGGDKTGYYHVGPADLNILIAAWQIKERPMGPGIASIENGICADFAHDLAGSDKTGFCRVGPSDLNILVQNWLVKEPPDGPGVDPDCLE